MIKKRSNIDAQEKQSYFRRLFTRLDIYGLPITMNYKGRKEF